MSRVWRPIAIGILASIPFLGGTGQAQTATTTTSTSTSTSTSTLLPHPFSPDTRACIRDARLASRHCTSARDVCSSAFQTAYAKCFKGSDGVKCATKCLTNQSKCLVAAPATRKSCLKTCRTTRKNDTKACKRIPDGDNTWASGDQGCLTTKDLTFRLCKFQCSEVRMVCRTNFTFCIADCPNL